MSTNLEVMTFLVSEVDVINTSASTVHMYVIFTTGVYNKHLVDISHAS